MSLFESMNYSPRKTTNPRKEPRFQRKIDIIDKGFNFTSILVSVNLCQLGFSGVIDFVWFLVPFFTYWLEEILPQWRSSWHRWFVPVFVGRSTLPPSCQHHFKPMNFCRAKVRSFTSFGEKRGTTWVIYMIWYLCIYIYMCVICVCVCKLIYTFTHMYIV